jgi:hypothetical protein
MAQTPTAMRPDVFFPSILANTRSPSSFILSFPDLWVSASFSYFGQFEFPRHFFWMTFPTALYFILPLIYRVMQRQQPNAIGFY